jgi:hypothetical protein
LLTAYSLDKLGVTGSSPVPPIYRNDKTLHMQGFSFSAFAEVRAQFERHTVIALTVAYESLLLYRAH